MINKLQELKYTLIHKSLIRNEGNIEHAAEEVGVTIRTIFRYLKKENKKLFDYQNKI